VRFTIDADVHLNALNPAEEGSAVSQELLRRVHQPPAGQDTSPPHEVVSPTLLVVEIAAAVARVFDDTVRGKDLASAVRDLPAQTWIALDASLAEEASAVGAELRLRGADAVYAAVARGARTHLVTRDRQQLERLLPQVPTCQRVPNPPPVPRTR
jgi:predicted nucleic acid-binding protein